MVRRPSRPGERRRRARLRRILVLSLAGLLVLVLVLSGVAAWSVVRAFPQSAGDLDVPGLQDTVVVQRDGHGIPTITARTADDLLFAQGFVHAQDRFWEMDFRRHMTSARLSELFGESQLPTDAFLRTLGWHRIAEEEVDALPTDVRDYYVAYADGVNAYLAERSGGGLALEYTVLGLQNRGYEPEPWTPADSVAWLKAMAWDLRTNIEDETARALLARQLDAGRLDDLYPGYPFDEHPVIMAEDPAGTSAEVPPPAEDAPARPGTDGAATRPFAPAAAESGARAAGPAAPGAAASGQASLTALLTEVDALVGGAGEGIGSNSWVVAGEHTASGAPLLANDPHLGASLPSVWTQMQLRCAEVTADCPFDVAGYSFSGLPGIVIGHNREIAWGFTNLTTDVADLYIERVDADGYWRDGEKVPFDTREETIRVAGGEDVEIEIRSTAHGPIISGLTPEFTAIAEAPPGQEGEESRERTDGESATWGGEHAVSLRWTALDAGTTAQAIFALNLAADFADLRSAAQLFDVPAQNLVYADTDGNIGYQAPGRLPIRGAGDGWLPQPGWDSAYDWQGFIPFAELPAEYNPTSGYIVTANNAIVSDEYPHLLSRDWDYGDRADRIVALLEDAIDAGSVTADDFAAIHMDSAFPVAAALQEAYAAVSADDAEVQAALDLLAGWDGDNGEDSAAAAFANVLWNRVTAAMVATQDAEIPRDDQSRFALVLERELADPGSPWWGGDREELLRTAAEDAYAEIVDLQGSDPEDWSWGELHALTLVHGTFGESGIAPIEALFNRGPFPVGGGSGVVNATGWALDEGYATETVPSMRMVIDLADWDASTWQNLTGASGHAFHPHYTDQTEGWTTGEQYPWGYTVPAVDAAAEDELTLRPG